MGSGSLRRARRPEAVASGRRGRFGGEERGIARAVAMIYYLLFVV